MQYFPEVIPLFEAMHYLSQRLSDDRTSTFINKLLESGTNISDKKRTCFEKIVALEAELDELIQPDPVMERYFSPLKTSSSQSSTMPLTIGSVLLSMPPELERPFTYDSLIEFYMNTPERARLDLFYERLFPFFTDRVDKDVTMSGFVAAVSSVLVDAEDKWALIDCASSPCVHLEALRPLVTETMVLIEERVKEISGFIAEEMDDFCKPDHLEQRLNFFYNSAITMEKLSEAELYPSVFSFNGMCFFSDKAGSASVQRLMIGLYINTVYYLRADAADPSSHIKLLKMLSDPNRFNILHELCHRQSYGQELADKFGGARSAIYYHLEKLLGYGLIDLEMTEYRMLYTMNKQAVYDKMNAIRDYLLDGWKPGDTSAETEKTAEENPRINA